MIERRASAHDSEENPLDRERKAENVSATADDPVALRGRAAAAEQQRDQYLARLQRTQADYENYQKRVQRDLAEERRYAHAAFARELLPVLDNLQRALDAAGHQAEIDPLVQGVALIQSQIAGLLDRFGITPIEAKGQPFDPSLHEAVRQEPRNDLNAGTITDVPEVGYRLHDRVLRPAKVVVAARPGR